MKMSASWFSVIVMLAGGQLAYAAEMPLDPKDATLSRVQMPAEFALVFSFGYVTDWMPKDPAVFERTLEHMKRTGINTIHCKYTDWRLKLCEKHGIMMMIDLAVPEHDLKHAQCEPGEAEDLQNLDGAEERFAAASTELERLNGRLAAIEKELGRLGVEVLFERSLYHHIMHLLRIDPGFARSRRLAHRYLRECPGGEAIRTVGEAIHFTEGGLVDGIVHVFPFTCMPENMALEALQQLSADTGMPVLSLSFDEHTSRTGLLTRLEAFVDLVKRRKLGRSLHRN